MINLFRDLFKKKVVTGGILAAAYVLLGACSYRLYLRQAINFPGKLGKYGSDLPAHIGSGRAGTSYSFMEKSFGFLMNTLKTNEKPVAMWLAFLTIATVFVTWQVMKRMFPEGNSMLLHILAFVSMLWMPVYLPQLNPHRYLGLQAGNIWHNSTYLGMRMAAMCLLLFYFEYQEVYCRKFKAGQFVWFTALLIFVNVMKPNFILCFAPAMALMLLLDCIRDRGKTLKRQILFGIPVLISLVVVIYQTLYLYSGSNEASSVIVDFAYCLKLRTEHPVIALCQSAAFPIVVLIGNWKSLKTDRRFRVSWLIWLVALAEFLLLCEDGPRKDHGNFSWGYCFALFLIFAVSMVWFYRNFREFYIDYRTGDKGIVKSRAVYLAIGLIFLLLHIYFGAEFFWIIFNGGSYGA